MQQAAKSGGLRRLGYRLHLAIPEVWLRFLLAILGLILAFAAALFSTVSRETGNLWATLVLASAALLLALIVGLTTVPFLTRKVTLARWQNAIHYQFTRVGIVYVAVVLLIGIAALNTGNNLLYIVVATLLGAIIVSGVASAAVLRKLELEVRLPERVFAGRPALAKFRVKNQRRWLASFSISVVALKDKRKRKKKRWAAEECRGNNGAARGLGDLERHLRHQRADDKLPAIFETAAYFPFIPPQSEAAADVELRFPRRGRYLQDSFGLATRFPFAFLKKTRRVQLARELIVYPPVEPAEQFFEILPLITGEIETHSRGRGYDLYRIRDYMPEDSARHVDWKATAKSGGLKVREFSREDERRLRIVFDNPAPGAVSETAYEKAIHLTASLAWHFANSDAGTSFVAQGYSGSPDIHQFLAYLAIIEPDEAPLLLEHLPVSGDYNLIFTARSEQQIPVQLRTCSRVVGIAPTT
jgi:uncharacterized protein (DUF58 family)